MLTIRLLRVAGMNPGIDDDGARHHADRAEFVLLLLDCVSRGLHDGVARLRKHSATPFRPAPRVERTISARTSFVTQFSYEIQRPLQFLLIKLSSERWLGSGAGGDGVFSPPELGSSKLDASVAAAGADIPRPGTIAA